MREMGRVGRRAGPDVVDATSTANIVVGHDRKSVSTRPEFPGRAGKPAAIFIATSIRFIGSAARWGMVPWDYR
jgi:hypothetical protein